MTFYAEGWAAEQKREPEFVEDRVPFVVLPFLFPSREKARRFISSHNLESRAVKVSIKIEKVPHEMRRRTCSGCGIHWADVPSDLCVGCEAFMDHQA